MISRRQLIRSGMAVSVLGLSGRMAPAVEFPTLRAVRISYFLVDARFDDARQIAQAAALPGQALIVLPRDALGLWHNQLKPALDIATQSFAGVTTEQGFFMLRTLAADHRLRVQFAATHATPCDGRIAHELLGPTPLLAHCQRQSGIATWQSVIGSAIRGNHAGRNTQLRFDSAVSDARRDEALVSWVIGPAASRA